jgi:hypothetical protein
MQQEHLAYTCCHKTVLLHLLLPAFAPHEQLLLLPGMSVAAPVIPSRVSIIFAVACC